MVERYDAARETEGGARSAVLEDQAALNNALFMMVNIAAVMVPNESSTAFFAVATSSAIGEAAKRQTRQTVTKDGVSKQTEQTKSSRGGANIDPHDKSKFRFIIQRAGVAGSSIFPIFTLLFIWYQASSLLPTCRWTWMRRCLSRPRRNRLLRRELPRKSKEKFPCKHT